MKLSPNRLYILDGMRGLAALAVLLHHTGWTTGLPIFRSGYLAVDFFFGLSGFVVAAAYQERLKTQLNLSAFIELRLIRLYPLILVGIALGAVKMIGQIIKHDDLALSISECAIAIICNALMLPVPISSPYLFPTNGPMWSLFCEIVINIIFAMFLFRMRSAAIIVLCVLSAFLVAGFAIFAGHADGGTEWTTLIMGLARVTFSFCVGMIIYRKSTNENFASFPIAFGCLLALVAILYIPIEDKFRVIYDLTCIFVLMPILLYLGSRIIINGYLAWICAFLGDVSYPLYIIHFPLLGVSWYFAHRAHIGAIPFTLGFMISTVIIAALLGRFYDQPIRNTLSQRLKLRRSARLQVI